MNAPITVAQSQFYYITQEGQSRLDFVSIQIEEASETLIPALICWQTASLSGVTERTLETPVGHMRPKARNGVIQIASLCALLGLMHARCFRVA